MKGCLGLPFCAHKKKYKIQEGIKGKNDNVKTEEHKIVIPQNKIASNASIISTDSAKVNSEPPQNENNMKNGSYSFGNKSEDEEIENVNNDSDEMENNKVIEIHSSDLRKDSVESISNLKGERRGGVRAETISVEAYTKLTKHEKDIDDELIIKNAISANEFLRNVLKDDVLQAVVDVMYERNIEKDEIIINQGENGMHLFVSASGSYEVIINDTVVSEFSDQRVFGELAILYNAKRLATIRAVDKGRLWVLDRSNYQQILLQSVKKEEDELLSFLKNVPTLNNAKEKNLQKAANLLKREFFKPNAIIVRQGDRGDKFYIIRAGTVTVSTVKDGKVATLTRGQYFGEKALLQEEFRQATVVAEAPGVECLTLDREEFVKYLGDIESFVNESKGPPRVTENIQTNEFSDIELKDLKRVKTLGVGGFGRVELVQHKEKENLTFALKYLKKIDMRQQQQNEHVFNEKNIQMSCKSLFIVKLYKTFKDSKYLYLLMESCLGGDLWTLLQKQKNHCFEESTARFFAACILEALAYLHTRDYIYRDLKPENMLLDADGYLKLTDFGFAKKLDDRAKTYTFAGTPEYVAPEIVLNRGHDRAVDYWAFGIFIFELLAGKTPFKTNDTSHMRTYNLILNGIDNITFPNTIPKSAQHLIKKLCKPKPTDRLGCQRNGAQDIKNHKWFLGFDWNKLNEKKIKPQFLPKLKSSIDTKYFEKFPEDTDIPSDDNSGWDEGFAD